MEKKFTLRILIILNLITWCFIWALIVSAPLFLLASHVWPDLLLLYNDFLFDAPVSLLLSDFGMVPHAAVPYIVTIEIMMLLILWMLVVNNFKVLFASFKKNKFFTPDNISRLTKIAYLMIALIIIDLDPTDLFYALVLLFFAHIFRYGYFLEEENKLTV